MTKAREDALNYAREHFPDSLGKLMDFLHIPSISTAPQHQKDIQTAAEWAAAYMEMIGLENSDIYPTELHPMVYGDHLHAGDAPTVLLYGHYDVQPVEPLEKWKNPPFDPFIQGENLYARGAADMKGQIIVALSAVEAILAAGEMPVNIKVFLEGEEEIGSPSIAKFLQENKDLLKCDFVLNLDAGMLAADLPTMLYGLRGIAGFELHVYGPETDLHSGLYGGAVHNPAQAICELVAGMHNEDGSIALPEFYDSVLPISEEERASLAKLPLQGEYYKEKSGVPELWGEKDYSVVERIGARPTLDVNGLISGYTGDGTKTVITTHAMTKITTRLVPNQKPEEVHQQFKSYLEQNAPDTITWELKSFGGGEPFIADLTSPQNIAFQKALETVWGKEPLYARMGGSIPLVSAMQQILGVESVLSGFALSDCNAHAPNEKLHLPTWKRGIETVIHYLYNLV